jgi:predicted Zn-dependent protease
MDSIRQSSFQATSQVRRQGISAGWEEDDAGNDDGRQSKDGFSECLVPAEELDQDEEQAEGARHEEELLEKYPLWENDSATLLLDDLFEILSCHMARVEVIYEFLALDADVPFASSCPNGAIYFTRGLLAALDDEEVLFFAAHELAHTELRHYATRKRRLSDLRQLIPHPIGSPARQRMDLAAVLVVRHQEEFEADRQAAEWVGSSSGARALQRLHELCHRTSPQSLQRPTHPKFENRVSRLQEGKLFDSPLEYLYSLLH